MLSVGELGKKLVEAGRLKLRPLCVYGTDEMPQDAVPSYKIDRCIARVAYSVALSEIKSAVYIEAGHEQCCGGGLVWMGFAEPHPKLKYFVTVGIPVSLAIQMSADMDESFIGKRSKIVYPEKRIRIEDAECTLNK